MKALNYTSYRLGPFAYANAFFYEEALTIIISEIQPVLRVGIKRMTLRELYNFEVQRGKVEIKFNLGLNLYGF